MVEIVAGRAHRLWEPLAEAAAQAYRDGRQVSVLVPEQYTLQAERDLIKSLGVKGFFRLDVLSPSRLRYRVFDALGADLRQPIDERGKAVAVARALRQVKDQLQYYAGAHQRPGLIQRMSDLLTTVKGAQLQEEHLQLAAQSLGERALSYKLQDTALVLTAYRKLLVNRFADQEDIHQEMLARLARGQLLQGHHILVYGFDVLLEPMQQLLAALSQQAKTVKIYLVNEQAQAEDGDAFSAVRHSVQRLIDVLSERGIPHRYRQLPRAPLQAAPAIQHVEEHLLGIAHPAFLGPAEEVRLFAAPTAYQEVQHVARQVLTQLRGGTQPEDIFVLAGHLSVYGALIAAVFEEWGIPHYIADKLPMVAHPLVQCLLSALRCVADGYRTEDVLNMVKTGFTRLSRSEGWALENYALAWGIRGRRWQQPFSRGEQQERDRMEGLRLALIQPVETLRASLADSRTAVHSLEAVGAFLKDIQAEERTLALEQALLAGHHPKEAAQMAQVMDKLLESLQQMGALMEEERIPIRHFALWLESALGQEEIGSLPPESGRVQVGQLGNLLLPRGDCVFLLGLNEGILDVADDGLFSREEAAAAAAQLSADLGLDAPGRQQLKEMDLWKAMSAGRDRLYLSYALANEEGGALHPLQQLTAICAMLPALREEGGALAEDEAVSFPPMAPRPALDALAPLLRQRSLPDPWAQAWGWLWQEPAWQGAARRLRNALAPEKPKEALPEGVRQALFDLTTASITRLERFADCPYQHFVTHGLRPVPRQQWLVEPMDTGRFYHDALEGFVRAARAHPRWPDVEEETCRSLMDSALVPLVAAWRDLPFVDTARQQRVSQGYISLAHRMAWVITQGAKNSAFRPEAVELRFGGEGEPPPLLLPLAEGSALALRGTIDRVDRYQGQLGNWLRVVDYKSGGTSLSPEKVWVGTQLQLMLYLRKALLLYPGSQPAGVFYQRLEDPIIETEQPEAVEDEIFKRLRLNGLIVDEPEVVGLMDQGPPLTLGAVYRKDGQPRMGKAVLSQQDIALLHAHSAKQAGLLAGRIMAGEVAREPAMDNAGDLPCRFCSYHGICRIDIPGGSLTRRLPNIDLPQLLERLREEPPTQ